jgi:hypothetical protein
MDANKTDRKIMNTKNLILLRDYLIALPEDYKGFDMGNFNIDITEHNLNGNHCGTAACMAGHMVYVDGLPKYDVRKGHWADYAGYVSGLSEESDCEKFEFLFSFDWEAFDNTIKGAVFRINFLLDNPNYDYDIDYIVFCIEHKLGVYA